MNVKVITRHGPTNYGSLLQSIATQTIIEKLGHDCQIIDYQRLDERGLKMIRTQLAQKDGWGNNLIKKIVYMSEILTSTLKQLITPTSIMSLLSMVMVTTLKTS